MTTRQLQKLDSTFETTRPEKDRFFFQTEFEGFLIIDESVLSEYSDNDWGTYIGESQVEEDGENDE